ncbi:MAG: DinB family protein [Flavobacterium sp.]
MNTNFEITKRNRNILENFLNTFSLEQLNKIPENFKNNLFWNIAHVVATQQLLVYKLSKLEMKLPEDWVNEFKKETKPERIYTESDVDYVRKHLLSTILETEKDYNAGKFLEFIPYQTSNGFLLHEVDDSINFNNFHEGMHLGIILQIKKFL